MRRLYRFPVLLLLFLPIGLHAQGMHRNPLVGAVTDSSATIAVWPSNAASIRITYGTDSLGTRALSTELIHPTGSGVVKVTITGLVPSTRYYYVAADSIGNARSPRQSFTTFPRSGTDAPVSLLFGSCQQHGAGDSGRVFPIGRALGGNVFLQLGDWGYPDSRIAGYPLAPGSIEASYELRLDTNYRFARDIL